MSPSLRAAQLYESVRIRPVVVEAEDVAAEAGRLEVVGRHAW